MSKARSVYILHISRLTRYQKEGGDRCERCNIQFKENDVVSSSSTGRRYCYSCATMINLVSGDIIEDLHHDKILPDSLVQLSLFAKKIRLDEKIEQLASEILKSVYDKRKFLTNNRIGIIGACLHLACNLYQQEDSFTLICKTISINTFALKRNYGLIVKCLENSEFPIISKSINEVHYHAN